MGPVHNGFCCNEPDEGETDEVVPVTLAVSIRFQTRCPAVQEEWASIVEGVWPVGEWPGGEVSRPGRSQRQSRFGEVVFGDAAVTFLDADEGSERRCTRGPDFPDPTHRFDGR